MKQKKLPTVTAIVYTIAVVIMVSVLIIWFGDLSFPKLDPECKRKFGQTGLLLTYCGALLTAYKIFWEKPFAVAATEAEEQIKAADTKLQTIKKVEKQLSSCNLSPIENAVVQERTSSIEILKHAKQFSKIEKFAGWIGIVLIVAGTIFQFVALG